MVEKALASKVDRQIDEEEGEVEEEEEAEAGGGDHIELRQVKYVGRRVCFYGTPGKLVSFAM